MGISLISKGMLQVIRGTSITIQRIVYPISFELTHTKPQLALSLDRKQLTCTRMEIPGIEITIPRKQLTMTIPTKTVSIICRRECS